MRPKPSSAKKPAERVVKEARPIIYPACAVTFLRLVPNDERPEMKRFPHACSSQNAWRCRMTIRRCSMHDRHKPALGRVFSSPWPLVGGSR